MLTVVQQNILSFLNLVKVVTFKSALQIFQEIVNQNKLDIVCNEKRLQEEISCINKTIQLYDLEIVDSLDELSSDKLLILINTGDNIVTQKSKFYDEHTRQLFSKVIKECVLSEKGSASETHCLNLNSQIGVSKTVAQASIEKIISDKWLDLTSGSVSLGMRTIVELEQSIKQQYPDDVKNCSLCKLIIVQGYICSSCNFKFHYACVKKYYNQSKTKCACPNCKEIWTDVSECQVILREVKNYEEQKSYTCSEAPSKKRKKLITNVIE